METIEDFPQYKINEEGQVFKVLKDGSLRLLKQSRHPRGLMVTLVREGKRYWRLVHTLMIKTYVKSRRTRVEHIDGDKTNNNLDNLKASYNYKEALLKGVDFVIDWVQDKIKKNSDAFWKLIAEAKECGLDGDSYAQRMLPVMEERWQNQAQSYANKINYYYGTELGLWDLYSAY